MSDEKRSLARSLLNDLAFDLAKAEIYYINPTKKYESGIDREMTANEIVQNLTSKIRESDKGYTVVILPSKSERVSCD